MLHHQNVKVAMQEKIEIISHLKIKYGSRCKDKAFRYLERGNQSDIAATAIGLGRIIMQMFGFLLNWQVRSLSHARSWLKPKRLCPPCIQNAASQIN
jgi:hypothetical protein